MDLLAKRVRCKEHEDAADLRSKQVLRRAVAAAVSSMEPASSSECVDNPTSKLDTITPASWSSKVQNFHVPLFGGGLIFCIRCGAQALVPNSHSTLPS